MNYENCIFLLHVLLSSLVYSILNHCHNVCFSCQTIYLSLTYRFCFSLNICTFYHIILNTVYCKSVMFHFDTNHQNMCFLFHSLRRSCIYFCMHDWLPFLFITYQSHCVCCFCHNIHFSVTNRLCF